ncbi:MAG TPA: MFS transporter [Pseudonocardiaceae bacterium]|nr:MFS transporter [Pseudonocardiaceae bacterium]
MSGSGLLGRYREVLAIPHLPGLLFWALAGRLHLACTTLVITFLVADWTGSYTLSGVVAGVLTVCQSVAAPWRGRSADRGQADRLVVLTALGYAAGLITLAALPVLLPAAGWPVAVALAAFTGLALVPVNQIARAGWPRLAPPGLRDAVYTADATLQELLFVVGPVTVAATVALAGATPGTLLVAAFVLVGGIGFAVMLRRSGLATPPAEPSLETDLAPRGRAGRRSVLAEPGLATLVVVMGLLVGGLIATDLVVIGWARERGEPFLAGVMAAVWAIGSLLGGAVVGARRAAQPPRLSLRLGAVFAGMAVLVPVLAGSASPVLLGVVLLLGGSAIAPALGAVYGEVARRAPQRRRAEAFGWQATASMAGAAVTAPIVGASLDRFGPAGAAVVAASALAVAVVIVSVSLPDVPDAALQGEDRDL